MFHLHNETCPATLPKGLLMKPYFPLRYQVLTVIAQTIIEAKNLELLVKITESEAFTPVIPSRRVDILVPPDHLRLFKERVEKFEVTVPDVKR